MPYKSKRQVAFMHFKHPKIAAEWDKKYGVPANLPEHAMPMRKARQARDRRVAKKGRKHG